MSSFLLLDINIRFHRLLVYTLFNMLPIFFSTPVSAPLLELFFRK